MGKLSADGANIERHPPRSRTRARRARVARESSGRRARRDQRGRKARKAQRGRRAEKGSFGPCFCCADLTQRCPCKSPQRGSVRAGLGIGKGAAAHRVAIAAPWPTPSPYTTHHPLMACANRPLCGEGRDGEPPPRGAPWGALATSGVAWPLPDSRGLARSSPPGVGRPAEPQGSVGRPGAPGMPATVTQQWPARRPSEKNPW